MMGNAVSTLWSSEGLLTEVPFEAQTTSVTCVHSVVMAPNERLFLGGCF